MSMSKKQLHNEYFIDEPYHLDIHQDGLYCPIELSSGLPDKKLFNQVLSKICIEFDKKKKKRDNIARNETKSFSPSKRNNSKTD